MLKSEIKEQKGRSKHGNIRAYVGVSIVSLFIGVRENLN